MSFVWIGMCVYGGKVYVRVYMSQMLDSKTRTLAFILLFLGGIRWNFKDSMSRLIDWGVEKFEWVGGVEGGKKRCYVKWHVHRKGIFLRNGCVD